MPHPDAGARDWELISSRLRRLALGLAGSADRAEELAQQTIAALLARQPDKVAHAGFARRTMLRLWLDEQRSARRRLGRLLRLATIRSRWHVDPDRAGDAEQVERIKRAVATLPPRQRAALVLRLVEGLSYAQVAEVLECSVGSARSSLHLARARIRAVLGEQP